MSLKDKDRLSIFAEQIGFDVKVESGVISVIRVPCLLANEVVDYCSIEKSFDPTNMKPNDKIGSAVHAVKIKTNVEHDGRVYHADGSPIESYIDGDGKTWSNISIKKGSQDCPEEDESARDLIHRYAKQIVGAVSAAGYSEPASLSIKHPFNIPNTFESRAAIGPVQDRVRDQRIAIIGLGGTGSYILDIIAKTPVSEIHLLDFDDINWHNLMRAPGAPTTEEIKSFKKEFPSKINYHYSKYSSLRKGIQKHTIRVDDSPTFSKLLSDHKISYAFVCIDQLANSDSPRQDVVYCTLSAAGIPFIDSGISITLDNQTIGGAVTISSYKGGSMEWKNIPNARVEGNIPGYRNVQLPEVNALAASLAVMEWRRCTGQYASQSTSFIHKFRLEKPHIVCP